MKKPVTRQDFRHRQCSNHFENKYLSYAMFNKNFEFVNDNNYYTVYHIVLDNNNDKGFYGIYANGVLSESISKTCFDNSNMVEPVQHKMNSSSFFNFTVNV